MKIFQSRLFAKQVKKIHKNEKLLLDKEIKKICKNAYIGVRKKGSLSDVFVHKYKNKTVQYLLSYRVKENIIELVAIGTHENYYRDLEKYLKSI